MVIITKVLYGPKQVHLHGKSNTLRESLHFIPCQADNDIWLQGATNPDRFWYYEMIFVYMDDILVVSQ